MTAQIGQNENMMSDMCEEISPRGKNLEKMNVMNFISKKGGERFGSTENEHSGQQKNINRQGSKKMIQGLMQYHQQQNQGIN